MTDFAVAYRQHVLPQIEQRITASAALIADGREDWSEQFAQLWRFAWDRGGARLPETLWRDLDDWMDTKLLEAVAALEGGHKRQPWQRSVADAFAEKNARIAALEEEIDYLKTLLWLGLARYVTIMEGALPRFLRFEPDWLEEAWAACCDAPEPAVQPVEAADEAAAA